MGHRLLFAKQIFALIIEILAAGLALASKYGRDIQFSYFRRSPNVQYFLQKEVFVLSQNCLFNWNINFLLENSKFCFPNSSDFAQNQTYVLSFRHMKMCRGLCLKNCAYMFFCFRFLVT